MVACRSRAYPSIDLVMALTLKITVGRPWSTYLSIRSARVGLLGPHCKKVEELWARPPVLTPVRSQASHSSSPCQFQTGQTPDELARMFRLLGQCLETLLSRWHPLGTPWSMFQAR